MEYRSLFIRFAAIVLAGALATAGLLPTAAEAGSARSVTAVSAVSAASAGSPAGPVTLVSAVRAVSAAPAGQPLCSSTPFRSRPSQHRWYRIPAIVRAGDGALVAFAEQRDRIGSDVGDFNVVTARSTDRGCSWNTPVVIGDDAANRVSNPVPILDATTGKILLFSVVTVRQGGGGAGKGLYLQTSSDDGRTFSPLLSRPVHPAGGYRGGLTGPGHGIQLTVSHPGRLILPMGYKTSEGRYGAAGIYSDDHGASWQTGFDQQDDTGKVNFIEGTIAELADGDLFISYRDLHDGARAGTARRYALSSDGGASLNRPLALLPLKIVSVQGSALAVGADPGTGTGTGSSADSGAVAAGTAPGELLFSAPAVTTTNLRREMTIFVSHTAGTDWTARYQVELEDTPAAYSDLVRIDTSTIGVLYETGTVTWKERIAFESIPFATLSRPVLVGSKLTYQRSSTATHASAHAKLMTTVTVAGIHSPPGRVTLSYRRDGAEPRHVAVDLTYSNRGVRLITLPKLKPGSYHLSLTYSGTGRIAKAAKSAGRLRVVR